MVEERLAREVVIDVADPDTDPRFADVAGKNNYEAFRDNPGIAEEYNSAKVGYSTAASSANALKREHSDQEKSYYVLVAFCVALFALSFIPWGRLIANALQRGTEKAAGAIAPIASATRERLGAGGSMIIGSEKMKRFSTADELLKWQQLHESGAVTDSEYSQARNKLLHRGKA